MKCFFLRFFFFVVLSLLFTSCAMHEPNYIYKPPVLAIDKMCISQCMQGKRSCEQICQLKNGKCVAKAYQEALSHFEQYRQEQLKKGEKVTKKISAFQNIRPCLKSCKCVISFNVCYTACGGEVLIAPIDNTHRLR